MGETLVTGATRTGFGFVVDRRRLEDRRVLRYMTAAANASNENMKIVESTMKYQEFILGEEQMERLEEHVARLHDGICDNEAFNDEMMDIINACKEVKN